MINRKTKDVGMHYKYGDKEYTIQHDLFRLNNFKVLDRDNNGNVFVMMSIQNTLFDIQVTPFYDSNIELVEGLILNVAYVQLDNNEIRVHGYEVSEDINRNANLVSLLSNPITRHFEGQEVDKQLLTARISEYMKLITDEGLSTLVSFTFNKFYHCITTWPAAVSVHHNIRGGLLLHLANVTRQAIDIAKNYTDVNMSLVVAGALLHDIGKVLEYTEDGSISEIGKYRDHITLSQQMINDVIAENNLNIDMRDLNRLMHVILSHHGKLEWGSTKVPAIKEAFIVHQADYIDTNMYIYHESYRKTSCGGSEYNKYTGAYIINENIEVSQNYDK